MPSRHTRLATLLLSAVMALATGSAVSEDIDIFSVDQDNSVDKPNVLIVLDNSANWSRQSQQWPGGLTQGQSEVRAIKNVINQLPEGSVNVGLLLYSTDGNASQNDGGYLRFHIRPMTALNKVALSGHLDTMFNNINAPIEKRSQGNPFGDLFWDVYNYLTGGTQSKNGSGTPASRADALAYTSQYNRFRSPLTALDSCRRTIIIFIGNNVSNGPTGDSGANVSALSAAGGDTSQIPFANYTVQSVAATDDLGYTQACYNSAAACSTAVNTAACTDQGYTSCSCNANDVTSCGGANQQTSKFAVFGVNTSETLTTTSDTTQSATVNLGSVLSCKKADKVPATYACPAASTSVSQDGSVRTSVTTSYSNCGYVSTGSSGCQNNNFANYEPVGTETARTLVQNVEQVTSRTQLGQTASCSVSPSSCSTAGFSCGTYNGGCVCDEPSTTSGCGTGDSGNRFQVQGNYTQMQATVVPGSRTPPTQGGSNFMVDEWARFMNRIGVPLPGTDPVVRASVTTYAIDVFNAQQNADFSALLFNTANAGGGRYYQAKNENQIQQALGEIFAEVQAVNTAFSSASLPVSATNRAQNENQVFIGLFRPDRTKKPLWFGNMKRYQVIASNNQILLGDKDGRPAVNNLTGFLSECAASFWTTDSGQYWLSVGTDQPPAVGLCDTSGTSPHSDLPDGPYVEKGAVAHVLRTGNTTGTAVEGNFPLVRNVVTRATTAQSALIAFDGTSAAGVAASTRDFIIGRDVWDDDGDSNLTEPRSTIHGDVVHSRPQPVNYGAGGIVVYYGANDGTFRAVRASNGRELWAFIAPEHFDKLDRLYNYKNASEAIKFFGDTAGKKKDYFFDGSIGLLQKSDNSQVWIFPTMRRGGRKVYALDVTNPEAPRYKWSKGCPNLGTDVDCDNDTDGDFRGIGQTWSQPSAAFVANYEPPGSPGPGQAPVLIFGGGYDNCEDDDTSVDLGTICNNAKGRAVYIVDADNGKLIQSFATTRSVVGDIALTDVNGDGKVDYGYAVDTGGSVYRINFTMLPWSMTKIASTTGAHRKFLFAPALLQARDSTGAPVIYVTVGSGDREHPLRQNRPYRDPITNRFYVFKDSPTKSVSSTDPECDDQEPADPQCLPFLNLDGPLMDDKSTPVALNADCNDEEVLPDSPKRGWYINLVDYGRGEQTVTSAAIAGGKVFFSTNRAEDPPDDEILACTNFLGEARGYVLDLFTSVGGLGDEGACGVRSEEFAGGGLPPSPVIATVPIDGVGIETICIGCGGRPSPLDPGPVGTDIRSDRRPIYWYTTGDTE
jgi:hypothetical protein